MIDTVISWIHFVGILVAARVLWHGLLWVCGIYRVTGRLVYWLDEEKEFHAIEIDRSTTDAMMRGVFAFAVLYLLEYGLVWYVE